MFLLARKDYGDRFRELVKRQLTEAIVNNRWWVALKRAISVETIAFSKGLAIQRNRLEGELVSKLEEAIKGHRDRRISGENGL